MRARRVLRRFGFDVIRYPHGTDYGTELARLLCGCDLLVDVGGHHGAFALLARELGYAGPIISFEPGSAAYRTLVRKAAPDSGWRVRNVALGDTNGRATLTVPIQPATASLLPWRGGLEARRGWQLAHPVREEQTEIRCLDDELSEGCENRVFLKVDTQGYDLRVLAGATQTLERVHALQVELAVDPVYEGAPDLVESLGWLRSRGFLPIAFNAFTLVEQGVPEFDCLLVKAPQEARPSSPAR